MRHNRDIPFNRLIGIISVVLLIVSACTQKMEAPAPVAKSAPPSPSSSPPDL